MSKPVKILAIVGSLVLVLLITLVVVAKVVITPERVRTTVLPIAEEQLGRKVDFKGLGVSIFSGITLEGFTVLEADAKETFVSLDGLVLRFQILPLFTGRVVVDEVRLERPRIRVVREGDGSFNFSTLGAAKTTPADAPKAGEPAAASGGGIDLLVARVTLRGGEVLYRDLALQPGQPFELTLEAIDVTATDISLEKSFPVELQARMAGAPLQITAQVDPKQAAGRASLTLKGLALKTFRVLAGEGYPAHLEPLTLDLELTGEGSTSQAAASGSCTLTMAGQTLTARFEAPALMQAPLPFSLALTSPHLQVDKLLPPASPESATQGKAAAGSAAPGEEPGPFDLPLKGEGRVAIDTLGYNALNLEKLALDWSLEKNVFTLKKLNANLAGGSLSGEAHVDLGRKGLDYRTALELKQIQADPLVSAFYPEYRGVVQGGLDLSLKASGRGTQSEALKRNLSGDGVLTILEGKVVGAPLVEGLSAFLGTDELKVLSFRETRGTFRIQEGKILFDSSVDGSQARMHPNGEVGLDGSLDVRLETRLNPELTRKVAGKGELAGALKDEEGWGLFPLRVKGSVNRPSFTLDSKAVRKQAEQKVKEKAIDELSRKLFKGDQEDSGKQLLQDSLKGLFGN